MRNMFFNRHETHPAEINDGNDNGENAEFDEKVFHDEFAKIVNGTMTALTIND